MYTRLLRHWPLITILHYTAVQWRILPCHHPPHRNKLSSILNYLFFIDDFLHSVERDNKNAHTSSRRSCINRRNDLLRWHKDFNRYVAPSGPIITIILTKYINGDYIRWHLYSLQTRSTPFTRYHPVFFF